MIDHNDDESDDSEVNDDDSKAQNDDAVFRTSSSEGAAGVAGLSVSRSVKRFNISS